MYGHSDKCTYYNNGVTLCLECDAVIEIDFMCSHGVHKPETKSHNCKPKPQGGKHRRK